jgi:hypothetical protein
MAFYIDNVEQERWDGEVAWSKVAYPVTQGSRAFKWVFNKDYSVSAGSDAAWIDYIFIPGITQYVSAGETGAKSGLSLSVSPNPVKQFTMIRFSLEEDTQADLAIYNLNGQVVDQLCSVKLSKGSHEVRWNCEGIVPGIYVVRLNAASKTLNQKMVVTD